MDKRLRRWATTRVIPLVAAAVLLVVGVNVGIEWNPLHGSMGFAGAFDVWRSYGVTDQILNGHLAQVYSTSSGLIGLPGALLVLVPAVALSQSLHLSVGGSLSIVQAPTAWPVMELWVLLLSASVLFAADALSRRLGVGSRRRWVLAALEVVVLWNVAFWYGHPEYPLALSFMLFAVVDATDGRWARCGWLFGVAIALQPIVLAVVGVAFAFAPARRWLGLGARIVVAPLVVVVGPLIANWHEAFRTLHLQPASLVRDHVTPWAHLAPRLSGASVSAAPLRSAATLLGFVLCVVVCRRRPSLVVVLASVAAALVIRCLVDPVLVSYYVFPPLAVGLLVAATAGRWRFAAVGVLATFVTVYAKAGPGGEWLWPIVVAGGSLAVVVIAWPRSGRRGAHVRRAAPVQSPGRPDPVSRAVGTP